MDQLSGLLGGQGGAQLQNLIDKFENGQHQQAPDQQVSSSYSQVASQLPADQYEQAARDAFAKLTPEQRQQFLQELQSETAATPAGTSPAIQNATADPSSLAAATTQLHQDQPGSLGQMFAPGGMFSSPIAKAVLLGITAMAAQRLTGRR
jgi:hypothetical protein